MSNPYWQPRPQGSPVWKTQAELMAVLEQYRKWYAEGLSDVEISARIKQRYVFPHNPQSQFRGKKR